MQQEAEMRQNNPLVVREDIFYAEPNDYQYDIFWVEFPIKLAKWLMHLQEALEYKDISKRTLIWTKVALVSLLRVDHQISRAVYFWVQNTFEGYIIKFAAENHQSYSLAEVVFKDGVRGRLIREIPLRIKVFMVEEGMLLFYLVGMVA